jgi:hypothetical protein
MRHANGRLPLNVCASRGFGEVSRSHQRVVGMISQGGTGSYFYLFPRSSGLTELNVVEGGLLFRRFKPRREAAHLWADSSLLLLTYCLNGSVCDVTYRGAREIPNPTASVNPAPELASILHPRAERCHRENLLRMVLL